MRILIAYYSRSGGTEKLAEAIKKELEDRGHSVDMEKIRPQKEHSFFGWWNIRMFKGDCDIQPPKIQDVSNYDVVCFGSPNWTRLSLPVARYIEEIKGLKYKNIGFFSTTAFIPQIEWYIFSAYLLELTFSRIVERKKGRFINSLLLSSIFKNWSWNSEYGQKRIKIFCEKLETPIYSLKSYFLEQKEIETTRLFVVFFSIFLISFFIFQIVSSLLLEPQILTWKEFFSLFSIVFFAYFAMLTILAGKIMVFWGKYLASISLISSLTVLVLFLTPSLGRPIILGYVLIFILFSFFRDIKTVFFAAGFSILCYFYLFINYSSKGVLLPDLDLSFILLSAGIIGFIAKNLQNHYIGSLEAQEEIETEKAALEIKIQARTKELKELSDRLEVDVQNRTKELQERIQELERFSRLAVGRELKMIELKKKIGELEKKDEKK